MPLLELRGVSKRYTQGGDEVVALDAVDLMVEEGESLALVGPSGSSLNQALPFVVVFRNPLVLEWAVVLSAGAVACVVVLVAAAWPALRAARVEVLEALRYE